MKESINYVVTQTHEIQVTASHIEEALLIARVRFITEADQLGTGTIAIREVEKSMTSYCSKN